MGTAGLELTLKDRVLGFKYPEPAAAIDGCTGNHRLTADAGYGGCVGEHRPEHGNNRHNQSIHEEPPSESVKILSITGSTYDNMIQRI